MTTTLKANNVEVVVNHIGATVTSFKVNGRDVLYCSGKSAFQVGKAIRGGIPICFPQFGPGALPQHGFARNRLWKLHEVTPSRVEFVITDDEETRKVWPHNFRASYIVNIEESSLKTRLEILNLGQTDLSFTAALHTYFSIDNISQTSISGLNGLQYIDKVKNGEKVLETRDSITIPGETDRVYFSAPARVQILDQGVNRRIVIQKNNFQDVVVWNPWSEKASKMVDLGSEDWKRFLCVEVGQISSPVAVPPGGLWVGQQLISEEKANL
eukprot:TRINITY_DN677_c0_g3_i2.p1 TRINITY_DN677_c0_g3~~TRINITY_DN677_c0_g3_i2.p1  ORF type:complete len:269 (-),score=40.14 TRINITY_DN677_c0_g3_i2:735-1541(-)